jgi:quinol monooxygenase YgiN
MPTISISDDPSPTTVISTFTAKPGHQAELVALLADQADTLLRRQAGFLGCAIHASQDGSTVVNYAIWRDPDTIRAMLANPAIREHATTIHNIATVRPVHYTVRHIIQVDPDGRPGVGSPA